MGKIMLSRIVNHFAFLNFPWPNLNDPRVILIFYVFSFFLMSNFNHLILNMSYTLNH